MEPEQANEQIDNFVDFSHAIASLENRASSARRSVRYLTVSLFTFIAIVFSIVIYNVFGVSNATSVVLGEAFYSFNDEGKSKSYSQIFNERASYLFDQLRIVESFDQPKNGSSVVSPEMTDASKYIQEEISLGLKNLESVERIMNMRESPKDNTPVITSTISSAIFSLGGVAFVVMLIQIMVSFMRYHSRLAELYDAQADALRASNGNAELAYKFFEHFSPNSVELGKVPTTLYEKALDTIKEVATKK